MEEIIKDLEHTIKYFKDSQNDFQRGRVFQAKKILKALHIHDLVGQSEQLVCDHQWKIRFSEKRGSWRLCAKCSKEG